VTCLQVSLYVYPESCKTCKSVVERATDMLQLMFCCRLQTAGTGVSTCTEVPVPARRKSGSGSEYLR
jgi:hypothetical protein